MNAIDMLKQDHRMVEQLFDEIEATNDATEREELFIELADALAVHSAIEENIFYPACKNEDTEETLLEALEEHLAAKRLLADLLDMDPMDEVFMAKINVLKESILRHVEEEEEEILPEARRLLGDDMLMALGNEMIVKRVELEMKGDPRMQIPSETGEAPRLD
ncbi:MAG TPA: hemerythrin domain-containing protein [Polyangia bacterium]